MEVRLTKLKKKIKDIFKRPLPSLKRKLSDKLTTIIELNIPEPNSCPECR